MSKRARQYHANLVFGGEPEIFERLVEREGKLFRVRFLIFEREGRLLGKVTSCEAIETLSGETCEAGHYFPAAVELDGFSENIRTFDTVVSPYFFLEFFLSQMTRAPSL
jgi:hypothetical protein